jgi:hypothetical protein
MTREEKAAEMNRRKEERRQVSGAGYYKPRPASTVDNTVPAYRTTEGTKSFQWENMKHVSYGHGSFIRIAAWILPQPNSDTIF